MSAPYRPEVLIPRVRDTAQKASEVSQNGRFRHELELGSAFLLVVEATAVTVSLSVKDERRPLDKGVEILDASFVPPEGLRVELVYDALRQLNTVGLHVLELNGRPLPDFPKKSQIWDSAYASLEKTDAANHDSLVIDPAPLG